MPSRGVLKRKHKKVAIGDLRTRLDIYTTNMVSRPEGDARMLETKEKTVWCKVETVSQRNLEIARVNAFGGNVLDISTHVFTVRKSVAINGERLLGIDTQRFRVITTEHVQEAGEYLIVQAALLGDVSQGAATG